VKQVHTLNKIAPQISIYVYKKEKVTRKYKLNYLSLFVYFSTFNLFLHRHVSLVLQ